MKTITDYILESTNNANAINTAKQIAEIANGGKNNLLVGLSSEVAMPSFKDSEDSYVRTVSLLFSKENKQKPDYILCLWSGPEYGGMSMLLELAKQLAGHASKIEKCEYRNNTNYINVKYDNKNWSIKVFTNGDYSHLSIER